jgi:hypothetical protein
MHGRTKLSWRENKISANNVVDSFLFLKIKKSATSIQRRRVFKGGNYLLV